jgi:hypothetical protein
MGSARMNRSMTMFVPDVAASCVSIGGYCFAFYEVVLRGEMVCHGVRGE